MFCCNNSENYNVENIQKELNYLTKFIDEQNKLKQILLNCLNNINITIQDSNNAETLEESIKLLKSIKSCLDNLRNLLVRLNELKKILKDSLDSNNFLENLTKYNKLFIECIDDIQKNSIETNDLLFEYTQKSTFVSSNIKNDTNSIKDDINDITLQEKSDMQNNNIIINPIPNEDKEKNNISTVKTDDFSDSKNPYNSSDIADNSVLLISEKENKVFLPYTVSELQEKLDHFKQYNTYQEIIDNEYTFPLEKYKNPIISRFRESYDLMKKKEHASVFDSLDLALKLSFNSLLNPAVISACKNLNELDIYLDCLNSNELDKFNLFEIKYELMPKKFKKENLS